MPENREVESDTIVAIATSPGYGGIGVIRVSGPQVASIARGLGIQAFSPRRALLTSFLDQQAQSIDQGIALFFPKPHSFTGEDVLEIQGHGGPVVLDLLVQRVLALGARLAEPGEFSKRAFFNQKLDLAQAEAISDLIFAASSEAARSAVRSLQGEFSERINQLEKELIRIRVYLEASIDFAEETAEFVQQGKIREAVEKVQRAVEQLSSEAYQGCLLQEGTTVALIGDPNVGKSSLLNRLVGEERAIVTNIPGTTRDPILARLQVDGLPIEIIDTAGLRETQDIVEQAGIVKTQEVIQKADQVLVVIEAQALVAKCRNPKILEAISANPDSVTWVINKIDLIGEGPRKEIASGETRIYCSARTGEGMDILKKHLKDSVGFSGGEGVFMARRRHLAALQQAKFHLKEAFQMISSLQEEWAVMAEELRQAQLALSRITGIQLTADDLLGEIFSQFCIGK